MNGDFDPHLAIRTYYGEVLKSTADLQTGACCTAEALSAPLRALLAQVHPEVCDRFYGCGAPIPAALEGATVLDLGCGSGRDVYLLAQLVGPTGKVIGIDMTPAQLEIARRHQAWHAERFGFANTHFVEGFIEDLASAGIADESVDVVVSNCVLNLSPDKPRVLREIFRVLKPGGEMYVADVFADRRLPPEAARDPLLLGECLGAALYVEDFRRLMASVGCLDVRSCKRAPIELRNPAIEAKVGDVRFESRTIRAFKLALEDRCEDYGQVAIYRGTLKDHPHAFELDDHHRFERHRPMLVCGNTADMLSRSRYAPHFEILGDKTRHFGLFDCAPDAASAAPATGGACC